VNLALDEHVKPHVDVAQQVAAGQLVLHQHRQLVQPAKVTDAVQKGLVQLEHRALGRRHVLLDGHVAQGVDHRPGVDLVGAARAARLAADAQPDGRRLQHGLFLPELHQAQDLSRRVLHELGRRAARRAALAVVAARHVLVAQRAHPLHEPLLRLHRTP